MADHSPAAVSVNYTDETVRGFALAAVVWGVVGMLVGVLIAAQLTFPDLTYGISWLSYGRLRPLHTNAVIFAFGGCALMATSYHVVQRTCQVPLFLPWLAKLMFWGWQLVIVLAAVTLPLGYTQGKEYAELAWPIDLLITVVWVAYAVVFFGTIATRAATAPLFAGLAATPVPELVKNAQAMAIGERLFANNCATCHGSDARGSKGFPNLADPDWLWGGKPENIAETITWGRQGSMPVLAATVGSSTVTNLDNYVLSLSGSPHNGIVAYMGKPKFAICAGCHGADGKGDAALDAPNLTDGVWLHGWGEDAIVAMVTQGKSNVMPAHSTRLTPEQVHLLTAYVWGLSNRSAAGPK